MGDGQRKAVPSQPPTCISKLPVRANANRMIPAIRFWSSAGRRLPCASAMSVANGYAPAVMEYIRPVFHGEHYLGSVVATYQLGTLLEHADYVRTRRHHRRAVGIL